MIIIAAILLGMQQVQPDPRATIVPFTKEELSAIKAERSVRDRLKGEYERGEYGTVLKEARAAKYRLEQTAVFSPAQTDARAAIGDVAGRAAVHQDRIDEAIEDFKWADENGSTTDMGQILLGLEALSAGDLRTARPALETPTRVPHRVSRTWAAYYPNSSTPSGLRARLWIMASETVGNVDDVDFHLLCLRRAHSAAPENPYIARLLSVSLSIKGDLDESLMFLRQAYKGTDGTLHVALGEGIRFALEWRAKEAANKRP
jgi:tetratricopeptide (TPR) repeat protein